MTNYRTELVTLKNGTRMTREAYEAFLRDFAAALTAKQEG